MALFLRRLSAIVTQLLLSALAAIPIQIQFLGVATSGLVPVVSGELPAISIQPFCIIVVPGTESVPLVSVAATLVAVPTLGSRLLALLTWTAMGQAAALFVAAFVPDMSAIMLAKAWLETVLVATAMSRFLPTERTLSLLIPIATRRQSRLQTAYRSASFAAPSMALFVPILPETIALSTGEATAQPSNRLLALLTDTRVSCRPLEVPRIRPASLPLETSISLALVSIEEFLPM